MDGQVIYHEDRGQWIAGKVNFYGEWEDWKYFDDKSDGESYLLEIGCNSVSIFNEDGEWERTFSRVFLGITNRNRLSYKTYRNGGTLRPLYSMRMENGKERSQE
jgi:hypothetical protein